MTDFKFFFDMFTQFIPIHSRHLNVADHNVGLVFPAGVQGFLPLKASHIFLNLFFRVLCK